MNWQWLEALGSSSRTAPGIRAVGLILAIRARRDDPTCNPSIRNICRYASVGHTTACAAIRYFEDRGLLTVERRRGRSNIYHLTVPVSGTPSVPRTGMVPPDPKCSSKWNTQGASVPASGTQVFPRANAKGKSSKPSPKQEDKVRLHDSEVPY